MDNQEAIRLMRNLPTMCEFTDAYGEPIDSDAYYEAVDIAISALHAQDAPDTNVGSMISRQTAKPRYIDANEIPYCEVLDADTHKGTGRFMADKKDIDALPSAQPYTDEEIQKMQDLEQAQLDKAYELGRQSAQPERLTDDDFETIRIHLNAYKEKLCNQQRWKEADEYQRIIDRFMAFASAQPDKSVLEHEYLKGWEDGRKNLLDAVYGTLKDFCEQCGEGKKYNGVMCGACNLDSWMSAIEEMKCTIEGKPNER